MSVLAAAGLASSADALRANLFVHPALQPEVSMKGILKLQTISSEMELKEGIDNSFFSWQCSTISFAC